MNNIAPIWYKDTDLMDFLIKKQVPFAEANIMKYVYRWQLKDGLKDLMKARDYLNALIAVEELKQPKETLGWKDLTDYPETRDLFDGIK